MKLLKKKYSTKLKLLKKVPEQVKFNMNFTKKITKRKLKMPQKKCLKKVFHKKRTKLALTNTLLFLKNEILIKKAVGQLGVVA